MAKVKKKKVKKVKEVEEVKETKVSIEAAENSEEVDFNDFENVTLEQLKNAPAIKTLLKKLTKSKYTVEPKLIKEIYDMNVVHRFDKDGNSIHRLLTNINTTDELQQLASLFEEVQAYKDRLTTINITYTVMKRDLLFLLKLCESFLYQYPVISKLKTEKQRDSKISEVLKSLVSTIVTVKNILSACELMLSNLSNTFFTLKAVKDVAFVVINSNNYNREE